VVPEYIMVEQETKCPKCKSTEVIKWCKRKTQNRGLIQRYKCKDCGKYFTIDDCFFRMRNNPQKITCALDLFYNGVSTRKVQSHFKAFYPHNSSWVSIYSWIVKYSKIMHKFTDKLKLNVGAEVQVDEVEYQRRISHFQKRGTQTNYFVDSIDTTTRFMVASEYCNSRAGKGIKAVIQKAKDKTGNQIQILTTDGYNAYIDSVKKVFGYSLTERKYKVLHNVVTQLKGEGFNHPIERMHNSLRQRTKTFRGFHGSVESDNSILKGFEIYYNFIRIHQGINKCPYELATALKFNSENKWLELIKLSKQSI
jgi:transposase-like protein